MQRITYIIIGCLITLACCISAEKISLPITPLEERVSFPILPLEYRKRHYKHVEREIAKRWAQVKKLKPTFVKYALKSDAEITQEFHALNRLRKKIYFRNLEASPFVSQEDYLMSQEIMTQGAYRKISQIAFDYNLTDKSYNASTILIHGYNFIALPEPNGQLLDAFLKLLINHGVSILVRVKPDGEYGFIVPYWKDRLNNEGPYPMLKLELPEDVTGFREKAEPVYVPYFHINTWPDAKGVVLPELYHLVQKVRSTYHALDVKGPIACHCSAGIGRTGTFMAAFILAELLDKTDPKNISIEEIVMQLSIQRTDMVYNAEQYLILYRFVEYYLEHNKTSH